jgi:hypothetical protein
MSNEEPTEYALQKSAQAWCDEATKSIVMDEKLAMAFAKILDTELNRMKDAGEFLWVVLANASGGNWEKETAEWQAAAAKARDDYHKLCSEMNRKTA